MARRRSPEAMRDGLDDGADYADERQRGGFAPGPAAGPGPGPGGYPSADGDLDNALRGIFANDPGAGPGGGGFAGNVERPREIASSDGPRALGGAPAPAGDELDIDSMLAMLPQGVEADGGQSAAAPMQSAEPQSVSLAATPPAQASGGAPPAPARQAFSSPVNLVSGGDTGSGLLGRGGGLFSGGRGMPGGPSGGPTPTKQMLAMLQALMDGEG